MQLWVDTVQYILQAVSVQLSFFRQAHIDGHLYVELTKPRVLHVGSSCCRTKDLAVV